MNTSEKKLEKRDKKRGLLFALAFNAAIVGVLGGSILPQITAEPQKIPKKFTEITLVEAPVHKKVTKRKSTIAKVPKKVAQVPKKAIAPKKEVKEKVRPVKAEPAKKVITTKKEAPAKVANPTKVTKAAKVVNSASTTKGPKVFEAKGATSGKGKKVNTSLGNKKAPPGYIGGDRGIVSRCDDFLKLAKTSRTDGTVIFQVEVNASGKVVKVKELVDFTTIDSGKLIKETAACVAQYKYSPKPGSGIERGRVTISYKYR
jgi:outer membrane biosynthesis protein TonB